MKVFLSHASEDAALARKIGRFLEDAGWQVWSDQDVLPGDNWADRIAEALRESEAMVVLVSPAAMASEWVRREVEFALGAKEYRGRLVPVYVGPHDTGPPNRLPWILRRLKGIDVTDQDEQEALQQIVNTLSNAN